MTTTPRLAPVATGDWTAEQREMLRGRLPAADRYLKDDPAAPPLPNILGLFGHHPELASEWLGWNARLQEITSLSPRVCELLILRVAWRTQCSYEWAQHAKAGRRAGLGDDEIAAVGSVDGSWRGVDAHLLDAADQSVLDSGVACETWQRLCEHFDDRQLLEILFLIGSYTALAQVLNSVGLPPDPDPEGSAPPLPEPEERR